MSGQATGFALGAEEVPRMPVFIRGAINLRGAVVPANRSNIAREGQ
jgi:hypothetical protein